MEILARELRGLGVKVGYHRFEDWWVEPADACLVAGERMVPVDPAVPLPRLATFEWMRGEGLEVEASGRLLRPGEASRAEGEGFLAVREGFDASTACWPGAVGQLLLFEPTPDFIPYALATDRFVPSAYVPRESVVTVLDALGEQGTLRWRPKRCRRTFRNLVADVPGEASRDEVVVMGAHLDSFPGTVGASDDAAGCAVLLEAARWLAAHRPKRTVRLAWFTGEELDRRGSSHFVEDYGLDPATVRLFVNVDGGFEQGAGAPWIQVSDVNTAAWVRSWLDVEGVEMRIGETQAADVAPFQRRGILTFWVCGRSPQPAHLPTDRPETIDRGALELIGRLSIQAAAVAAQEESRSLSR